MANAYTDILSGTSLGTNLVKTAYDRLVEFNLRSLPWYRSVADKRPVDQTQPGTSVVFNLYADLADATSTLAETTDPDSVQVPATTTVTVTLAEYGNAALVTRKLRLFTLSDVDPAIADIISFNMVSSLDTVVRDVLRVGTNVVRENGGALKAVGVSSALASVAATDTFKSRDIRAAVAYLRKKSAMPRIGPSFVGYIHPDVSYDLRSETTNADWRTPHAYSAAGNIWAGSIGEYEGVEWIETPRAYSAADGASSAVVHRTLICGRQALAECVAEEPHVIVGPVTDKLMRFRPIGWYGVLGWALYRQDCLVRIETSTSLQ
jgi:N4-gp56 family major capsid protein